ncbi:MAG: triose-phosphate isomerase [Sulfobacillus thermotolerans]|nr:triose-phosphate isomerase [Sulfobacillus thermotolerans]
MANWKMHKTVEEGRAFGRHLIRRLSEAGDQSPTLVVCPTLPGLWPLAREFAGTPVGVGAQNLDLGREGALTGAVSGYLLREAGAQFVIIGHSERRQVFHETDDVIGQKVAQAYQSRLRPILCVGESAQEYRQGSTLSVVERQLQALAPYVDDKMMQTLIVAYEPVWAIGTGEVPEPGQANHVAAAIREVLDRMAPGSGENVPILYGGSVNAKNIRPFMGEKDIDGALVGGASLQVEEFLAMARNSC